MIAVDTNVLVHAHRSDSPWHEPAFECVRSLAESRSAWAIPWPCIHEFLAIVTHPRIYNPPTRGNRARKQVEAWLKSPSLVLLSETPQFWDGYAELLRKSRVDGPRVHDARVAALCLHHGVRELLTADRDLSRFPELRCSNPLLG
jgi:toxin-antitoxin system PIN domain toxin